MWARVLGIVEGVGVAVGAGIGVDVDVKVDEGVSVGAGEDVSVGAGEGVSAGVAVGPALEHVNARTVISSAMTIMILVFMLFSFYDLSCARMQPI